MDHLDRLRRFPCDRTNVPFECSGNRYTILSWLRDDPTQLEETNIEFKMSGLPHCSFKILVFVNSWRRSRVIIIDKIFKPIYIKVMLTTHSVKNQRRWFGTWTMQSYLSHARQLLRCKAKHAFFVEIKASFTALVGISWERIIQPMYPLMAIGSSLNP